MARKRDQSITIGIRIEEDGLEFFGTDEVNERIAAGAKVLRIEPGNALVEKVEGEDGGEEYALVGCDLTVVLTTPAAGE